MRTMTCRELGGPCGQTLLAETLDEMVQTMSRHVMKQHPDTAREVPQVHDEDPKRRGREMKPKWDAAPVG